MTKSNKHKKEFRKEKNKIKLKLTAKLEKSKRKKGELLPKGLNVTDTSFKSKKIILPNHLRPDDGAPCTKKHQSFKELMSHMNHHNASVQQDGMNGIKELVAANPAVLDSNLSQLLAKISELTVSLDFGVRKCALKLLQYVVQSTTTEKVSPHFPLLNAQLLCAMNHIQSDIQQDSHLVLDIFLDHLPKLVSTVAMQILPDFLEQISRKDLSKTGKRVLAINPSQRLTSMKWRQEVLNRVHRILDLLNTTDIDTSKPNHTDTVNFIETDTLPLYNKHDSRLRLTLNQPGQLSVNQASTIITNHSLKQFTAHLLPLLVETWIESMAGERLAKSPGGSLIGPECAAQLLCVCKVIVALRAILCRLDCRQELLDWFEAEFADQLFRHFLQHFPFSSRNVEQRKKSPKIDPECRQQNLIMCFLWAHSKHKTASKYTRAVSQYLSRLFEKVDQQPLSSEESNQLLEILSIMCSRGQADDVVAAAAAFCNRVRSDRRDRLLLSRYIIQVALETTHLDKMPSLREYLESCPNLLLDVNNTCLLPFINRAVCRNRKIALNAGHQLKSLVEKCRQLGPNFSDWRAVFELLYWTVDDASFMRDLQLELDQLGEQDRCYGQGVLDLILANN